MLGFNGGLLGKRRVPTLNAASGLWLPNEQSVARRELIWPIPALASLVFELDAKNYSSGQTFANTALAPADASSQSAYDFFLGSSSSAAGNDPSFTSASDASYFSFDGGDYFTLASGATSTTFLKNMHKSGASFSVEVWFYYPGSGSAGSFFDSGTSDQGGSDMSRGVIYTCTEVSGQQLRIKRDSAAADALSQTATAAFLTGINMAGVSYQAGSTSFFYRNGSYDLVSGSETFTATLSSPGTSDTINAPRVGARGDGAVSFVPNGTRLYRLAVYNTALSKSEFDILWSANRSRFGL